MLETKTEETISFFGIGNILIGERGGPFASPGYAYVVSSFVSEMIKLSAISEAEYNSSVGADMGSKLFGAKAAIIFVFRE